MNKYSEELTLRKNIPSWKLVHHSKCLSNLLMLVPPFYVSPPPLMSVTMGLTGRNHGWTMDIGVAAIGTMGTKAPPDKERNLSIRNQKVLKY